VTAPGMLPADALPSAPAGRKPVAAGVSPRGPRRGPVQPHQGASAHPLEVCFNSTPALWFCAHGNTLAPRPGVPAPEGTPCSA